MTHDTRQACGFVFAQQTPPFFFCQTRYNSLNQQQKRCKMWFCYMFSSCQDAAINFSFFLNNCGEKNCTYGIQLYDIRAFFINNRLHSLLSSHGVYWYFVGNRYLRLKLLYLIGWVSEIKWFYMCAKLFNTMHCICV